MRVFLTGGSGYVGRHILAALLDRGHKVCALSRQPAAGTTGDQSLEWVTGNLGDPPSYAANVDQCDAVIHAALEYRDGEEMGSLDQVAVKAFLDAGKHLIYTGNLFSCPNDAVAPIREVSFDGQGSDWRNTTENLLLAHSVSCAIIRLGFVYGGMGSHLLSALSSDANGNFVYCTKTCGEWPMIHIKDVAALYLAVLEQQATGIFHAAPDQATPVETVIRLAAKSIGKDVVSLAELDAEKLGVGTRGFMALRIVGETARSRQLGWRPSHSFAEDFAQGSTS